MRSQDGKIIKAIAKEKEQARKEYDASIRQGRTAGLIEHATDDGEDCHDDHHPLPLVRVPIQVRMVHAEGDETKNETITARPFIMNVLYVSHQTGCTDKSRGRRTNQYTQQSRPECSRSPQ